MPTVSLTDTTSQLAEIARRQRLAEALSQQGSAPVEIQSYKGIQAPIPKGAALAKALESLVGALQEKNALKDAEKVRGQARDEASTFLRDQTVDPGMALTTDALKGAQNIQQPGMIDRLKGMAPQNAPLPSPAAPPPSPQALAAGLTGQPMPQQPMPQPMPQAPPPAQGPQGMSPVPQPMGPQDFQTPLANAQPHERSMAEQQQRLLAAAASGNPYLEKIAPTLYEANQNRIDRRAELQDTADLKRQEVKADEDRAIAIAKNMPGLSEDQRSLAMQAAQAQGSKGLDTIINKLADKSFKEKFREAKPEELKGYPSGTVGQIGEDGKLVNVYNPSADKNREAQLRISQAQLGISAAHLNLDRQKFSADQAAKTSGLLDPATLEQMAAQAWQGDASVFQNLGRGQQGAQNIVGLRKAIVDYGARTGKTGKDLAAMNAHFIGTKAEERAIGNRLGAGTYAAEELTSMTQASQDAYSKLPRGQFVPFNKLRSMVATQTSSPEQAAAYAADYAVINAYARAISPTGQPHVNDQKKGEALLSGATSQAAHDAVLHQMMIEAGNVKGAGENLRNPGGGSQPHIRKYNPATGKLE